MSDNIIVDGIIDAIKELKEVAKCPFCNEKLEFDSADKSYWGGSTDSFRLLCKKCSLEFRLRNKKNKWTLEGVRKVHSLAF